MTSYIHQLWNNHQLIGDYFTRLSTTLWKASKARYYTPSGEVERWLSNRGEELRRAVAPVFSAVPEGVKFEVGSDGCLRPSYSTLADLQANTRRICAKILLPFTAVIGMTLKVCHLAIKRFHVEREQS